MIETRPDLSRRTALSKSALNTFEWCQTEAWFQIRHPLPFIPNEAVAFGSAVDRGTEVYMVAARAGLLEDVDVATRAMDAAIESLTGEVDVDLPAIKHALDTFGRDIIPSFVWDNVRTQAHIALPLPDLGDCDGHPDVIFGDNRIADIKTGSGKTTARTLELGFYVLLVEEETGKPVPSVSYISYNRKLTRPKWGVVTEQVTDEFRRWAYEGAAAFVRAKKADEVLNRKAIEPQNFSFSGGPAWPGKCAGCAYSPANGGPCPRAYVEAA